MNVPTHDTIGSLIFKEAMHRERKALLNWEYKYGPRTGASMDPERKPGRLFLEIQRGRRCTPLDEDGAADCFVMMRINDDDAKRSSTIRALEPLWNEQFQLDCTRADTLHLEIWDDVSMRHVKSTKFAQLLGGGSVRVGALKVSESSTRVIKLMGGAAPSATLTVTLMWKAQESATQATHEASLKLSLAQMRHELAISRAQKSSWENSSGYLRAFGVLAPAVARNGDLTGPASAEVFADAKPPPGQPRREGPIPVSEMRVRSSVAEAVSKLYGKHDFAVITQSPSTGSIDIIVGPERKAKHYADFQAQWKAVDDEITAKKVTTASGYPVAPDGTALPCLFGGYKRRATRFF